MKKILLTLISILTINAAYAGDSGIGLSRGFGGVDGLSGYQLDVQHYWNPIYTFKNGWDFTGYWNTNLSYWQSKDTKNSDYQNITILSLAPVLRLERDPALSEKHIAPFIDAGFGLGIMNRDQFSEQKLGGYATMLQTFGAGINFGEAAQYDLSYHYVVYNNAGEFKHDDGLFVNQISFDYHFA